MKKSLQSIIFILSTLLLTSCTSLKILSYKADGLCLITQQDMKLSNSKFKYLETNYAIRTATNFESNFTLDTIGYIEIGIIPKFTKLSVYRIYERYESTGYYAPSIVVRIDEGKYQGIKARVPYWREVLDEPIMVKSSAYQTGYFYQTTKPLWYTGFKTHEISGKMLNRSDVTQIKYNDEYLKKCNE